jgi:hypothetical protein
MSVNLPNLSPLSADRLARSDKLQWKLVAGSNHRANNSEILLLIAFNFCAHRFRPTFRPGKDFVCAKKPRCLIAIDNPVPGYSLKTLLDTGYPFLPLLICNDRSTFEVNVARCHPT